MADLQFVAMTPDDVELYHTWTVEEDWNLSLPDIQAMYNAYPHDYFVAKLNSETVGTISGICHEDKFGCLGSLIVSKDHRGKGIARFLMQNVEAHFKENAPTRNCFLSGRFYMVPAYKQKGYSAESWDVISYFGKSPSLSTFDVPPIPNINILPVTQDNWAGIFAYDQKINITLRETLLKNVFHKEKAKAFLAEDVNGTTVGYGIIQPATWGYRVSPLYADTPEIGRNLLKVLIQAADGARDGLTVDAISANCDIHKMALELGMAEKYRLKRLYTGEEVKFETNKVYALCNTDGSIV